MKWPILRLLWGVLLILGGILFLLYELGYVLIGDYAWAIILGIAGLAFLSVFITDRRQWWALFPGFALLIGGSILLLENVFPQLPDELGGVIALGGIGLAFLIIFLINFENWWALIPAGVLLSLAVAIGLSAFLEESLMPGVFLIGLGLTFGGIGFMSTPQGRMRWAFIPAVILLVIGIILLVAMADLMLYLLPLGFIAVGVYIIYVILRSRQRI
jgi:hypothetical protein